jgi:YfiH family protein
LFCDEHQVRGREPAAPWDEPQFQRWRRSGKRPTKSRYSSARSACSRRVVYSGQIHSDIVQEAQTPGKIESCDALTTNQRDLYLAISVADCIPIFLYDPVSKCIAAVHSGWKGTEKGIVANAIRKMSARYGSNAQELNAFIGPGASACCYEVGEDVAKRFPDEIVDRSGPGNPRLDLKRRNRDLLIEAGVNASNIETSADCTIVRGDRYHSFRRDGNMSGRMLGVIGLKALP